MAQLSYPRPLPRIARFERLGFGLFLHWGLYSQLGAGEWAMHQRGLKPPEYNRLAETFTAVDFDARAYARLAREAGMGYIVLTTRHHEGFSLYDTRGLSTFDAMHAPAGRDLVAEFVAACREEGIVPFLYHTTLDWQWEPDWQWRRESTGPANFPDYLDYLHASVEVLCRHYGPLGGLWFDGNWGHPKADWREERLYALIRRHQPEAIIVNNTGIGAEGRVGHPEIDGVTFEQSLPKPIDRAGWPKHLAGEMCQTMNAHWGVGARDLNHLSPAQLIQNLCLSRRAGANYLLNVGPTAQGGVPDYEGAALRRVGVWTALHRDALHAARPVPEAKCSGRDFVLRAGARHYYFAFDLGIQGNDHVTVAGGLNGYRAVGGLRKRFTKARWLDNDETLHFTQDTRSGLLGMHLTPFPYGTHLVVRVAELT